MFSYFEQWKLSQRFPFMRSMGQKAILDFLNSLNDEHTQILEEYFQDHVVVEKLNYKTVLNLKVPLEETAICEKLCSIGGFHYFNTWRDENHLYITSWR